MYAPGDLRVEGRPDPAITAPTDAIIRLAATCVCGSDLWTWRGTDPVTQPTPMGHEYVGIVEEVGAEVRNIKPGQFAVGSFMASDNTCPICQAGYQSRCANVESVGAFGCGREAKKYLRVNMTQQVCVGLGLLAGVVEFVDDDHDR